MPNLENLPANTSIPFPTVHLLEFSNITRYLNKMFSKMPVYQILPKDDLRIKF